MNEQSCLASRAYPDRDLGQWTARRARRRCAVTAGCGSSLLAFVACPSELKRLLKVTAPPYLCSGPSPVAFLASALVGLQLNEARGDELRTVLWARTWRILEHLDTLGAFTLNRSGFPIVEVPLADPDDEVSELLATLDRLADVVPLRRI
jgi:8-amino-7-oxononanoate synthase